MTLSTTRISGGLSCPGLPGWVDRFGCDTDVTAGVCLNTSGLQPIVFLACRPGPAQSLFTLPNLIFDSRHAPHVLPWVSRPETYHSTK